MFARNKIMTILVAGMIAVAQVSATTYYVSPDGSDSSDGLSWANAFATINKGIDAAVGGDTVEVNEGTYYEAVDFDGKAITVQSTNPFDWDIVGKTIINGNGATNVVNFNSSEDADSILKGFAITGGTHGVYSNQSGPTITNNIIRDNTAEGVYCYYSSATTKNNIIQGNINTGVNAQYATVSVKNNIISDSAIGLTLNYAGGSTVTNNTVVNNTNYGIKATYGSPTVKNCIVWDNNDDLYGCTATYSCIQDGDGGTGNISFAPCFVDAENNDFHISLISPCADSGSLQGNYEGQSDMDSEPRVAWGRVDIGADEIGEYSTYGMQVESANISSGVVTIVTTGATYILSQTSMDMYRRIDPNTNDFDQANNNKGREVAHLAFLSDVGPLSIEVNQENVAIIQSTKATFKFFSDSLLIIKAKQAFDYSHTNLIANALWNAPLDPNKRGLDRMWTDGYGGSLHASMSRTTAPAIGPNDVDSTTLNMSTGDVMAHMVYPPKTFDFEGLYGQDARPFIQSIYSKSSLDGFLNGTKDINDYIDDGFGIFLLWNSFYTPNEDGQRFMPMLLDSGILGYDINDAWDPCVRSFIDLVHSKECKVIAYMFFPGVWLNAGEYQKHTVTLRWMRDFQSKYGFNGWYFDFGDCNELFEDYDFMRQARTDVGADGILNHHDSSDAWESRILWYRKHYPGYESDPYAYQGLRAIMLNTYVNYTYAGETGDIAEVSEPNDLYFRFFTCGYGMSQAYGAHKRVSNGRAPMSIPEIHRLVGENLNGWSPPYGDAQSDPNWQNYFKPAYDARKAQFINDPNNFDCDVDWPIDATTGWFRYPTDVNVRFANPNMVVTWTTDTNSDSEVSYTSNGIWWPTNEDPYSPDGPDGTVNNSSKVTSHSITLAGLDPCTFYKFRISSSNGQTKTNEIVWSWVGEFNTPPPMTFSHWPFDENDGTTAHDTEGYNDATFNGNDPCWVSGKFGGAIDCNGVSDYFSVSSLDGDYNSADIFSVAGWFKTTKTTGKQTIVGCWGQGNPGYPNYNFYYGWQVLVESNNVVARFGNSVANTTTQITGTKIVTDANWHHFALVYPTSSSNAVLYVDANSEGTPGNHSITSNGSVFRIGDGSKVLFGSPTKKGGPFSGTIDDVMLFERALSADEVEQLFNSGS